MGLISGFLVEDTGAVCAEYAGALPGSPDAE